MTGWSVFTLPPQHLREAGEVADLDHLQPGLPQGARGTAAADQLYAQVGQGPAKVHQAGFVVDTQEGSLHLHGMRSSVLVGVMAARELASVSSVVPLHR